MLDGSTSELPNTGAGTVSGEGVIDLPSSLVDQSLVTVMQDQHETRYWWLEPIRQYMHEYLQASGEKEETRLQRARHYLAFAERAARLGGSAVALRERIGITQSVGEGTAPVVDVSGMRTGPYAAAWSEGRALTRKQTIAEAMAVAEKMAHPVRQKSSSWKL